LIAPGALQRRSKQEAFIVPNPHRHIAATLLTALALAPACAPSRDTPQEDIGLQRAALASCTEQPISVAVATASSEQNNGHFAAANAIDFRQDTRWSSDPTQSAPQWLRLDFGQRKLVSSLSITWQTAFSPSYEIQASDNAVNWAVVRPVTNNAPGVQTVSGLDVTARYVRIFARTLSGYGNVSIIELTVFGDDDPACVGIASSCGQTTRLQPALAQATSQQFSYTPGSAAVDGVYSTRWSSAASDDQALALDLGAVARIDSVRVTWETAFAAKYAIETGPALGGPWTQVARNDAGHGGVETLAVGVSARFVRLHGIQRATQYGYSIWELDVLGSTDTSCAPNLLTRGWDAAASANNIGEPNGQASVDGLYAIDPTVLNRIDLTQSGQYCPVSGPGFVSFTQHVTVPTAGSQFHLVLDFPRNSGTIAVVVASATLGGVQGSNFKPVMTTEGLVNPAGELDGAGKIEADFVTNLAAGQNVDLTVRFAILGAGIPNTNCGVRLQSYTLGGATLTSM
jgi:hypothetical protein